MIKYIENFKNIKRWIDLFVAICLVIGLLPVMTIPANATSLNGADYTSGVLGEKLDTIFSAGIADGLSAPFPAVDGTFSKSKMYSITFARTSSQWSGYQCAAYAKAVYNYLFGYDPASERYRQTFSDARTMGNLSFEDFQTWGVKFGAYLRTTVNSSGAYDAFYGHSVIILSYNKSSIVTLEANLISASLYQVQVKSRSWSNFNSDLFKNRYVCSLSQPLESIYANLDFGSSEIKDNQCMITFDPNGGTVSPTTKMLTAGTFLTGMPTPTRSGYIFRGWATNKIDPDREGSYSTAIVSDGVWTFDKDTTLYASWQKIPTDSPPVSNGLYTLTPKCAGNMRLDVSGASTSSEANVQIYTSNDTAAQKWEFTYLGNGYYTITSRASSKVLDVSGAAAEPGTNVQQYAANGSNAQQWTLKDAGNGYYYIVPRVNSALCLDVAGAGTTNKTNVQIYTANQSDAQKWMLTETQESHTHTSNSYFYSDNHPHYKFYTCTTCGEVYTDGSTTNMSSCSTCNPSKKDTWSSWSSWSTNFVSASSSREVEMRQIKVSDAYTEYRYGLWRNTNNASWCPDYGASLSSSGGSWYESYSSWSKTRMYRDTGRNAFCAGGNHNHTHIAGYDSSGQAYWDIYSDDGTFTGWGRLYYYWEETRTIPAVYETQYRYRDLISI